MKRIFIALIFALVPVFVFAAPFGLSMGMTIDEIAGQCTEDPSFLKDDVYFIKPVKSHPLFDKYWVYVNENAGLYQIRAQSAGIITNKYGTELQNAFNDVKDRISKTYGTPRLNNKVDPSIFFVYQNNEYWFMTLGEGSRELSAVWGNGASLADNLDTVTLECSVVSGYVHGTGRLILQYKFKNIDSVEDEQDSVF